MRARTFFIAATLLAWAGAGVFEARVSARQRAELQTIDKRTGELRRQAAALRREQEVARRALDTAAEQLAAMSGAAGIDAAESARRSTMETWLARVKQLRRLFDERPDQRIPEMQWLTDEDWLRLAKRASFDDEHHTRKALGEVRAQAATNFGKLLNPALQKFALTAKGEPPPSILALMPFFETTIDAAALERYEITKGGNTEPNAISVREKSAVDPEYDSRRTMSSNGRNLSAGSMGPPYAWIPDFQERSMGAFAAYVKANNGVKPEGFAPILPYFNPPLEPAKVALILRFEQERGK